MINLQPLDSSYFRHLGELRARLTTLRESANKKLELSLSEYTRGPSLCWKLLKKLNSRLEPTSIDPNKIRDHFSEVYFDPNAPLALTQPWAPPPHGPHPHWFYELQENFTDADLCIALSDLNGSAAPGPQKFSSSCIKSVFINPLARAPLLTLMNACWGSGTCPMSWGHSEIFILFKGKGTKDSPDNYRGINLLNDLLRLYERLVNRRFKLWLEKRNLLGDNQFGFRAKRSTADAVFELRSLVAHTTIHMGVPMYVVFVDLKKAFPSLRRQALIDLLFDLACPAPILAAISAINSFNSASLRIDDLLSPTFCINKGTREGGINSPDSFNFCYGEVLSKCGFSTLPEGRFFFWALLYSLISFYLIYFIFFLRPSIT